MPNTIKDAEKCVEMLKHFGCSDIKTLRNPTRREFSKAMCAIAGEVDCSDPAKDKFFIFVYYSGHGEMMDNKVCARMNSDA